MTEIGTSARRRAGFTGQWIAATLLGIQDAIDGAEAETQNSGLPRPNTGGPGNAYKHLLITGELYRRLGPTVGPIIAELRERVNVIGRQTAQDTRMDRTNNAIVIDERPHFETWEDVVEWARAKMIEAAEDNGDGEDGRAFWYEAQPRDWRPDFTDKPITAIEKGGAEHRYQPNKPMSEPMAMADASGAIGRGGGTTDPLDQPAAGWSEDDVRQVINSPAYLLSQHPRRGEAQRMVRLWFEQEFGTGAAPVDATGRIVARRPERKPALTAAGACPVVVRAHARAGGKVAVREYCRAKPA